MKKDYNLLVQKNRGQFYSSVSDEDWFDYRWQMANRIKTKESLMSRFNVAVGSGFSQVIKKFPFSITPYFFSLMDHDAVHDDPLFCQVFPDEKELISSDILKIDPFRENKLENCPLPGVLKRYPDRVVLLTTSECPSLCRYCTRKWNWAEKYTLTESDLKDVVVYLKANPHIREVIISGGEPLLLENHKLDMILSAISSINSVQTIRIGTRILSFLPYRIDDGLTDVLKKYFPVWIVTHFNHSNEISKDTEVAVKKILQSGSSLCNQSVLLKNINTTYDDMRKLNNTLQQIMVKPYYLFYPDLIEGTVHFRSDLNDGISLMQALRGNCSGMSIPQFVIDLPEGGKVPLLPEYIVKEDSDFIYFKNYENKIVQYKK
ncbi:MAG: hypothetical protein A2015_03840 [Spirochaetes bacterium GWF1_31_7]|nr:MAG: hypothetical protein A2Y30_06385 [Spirochaetes bacterium GWE1_32_154]OHD44897.1 MAG: hypothetical protein A2Y29_06600 [Spirochaetes bacterium GWE2_31_10]OHD48840.1 MAG: hypothetical protein A2015_03840 [Spirochaetes bacterium GWF1_31_7]OHD78293.1 MAG: hypothetical protein A2355_02815 [Spirochaetes bacterium RIFOXYB1_FULL_32_8]HBD92655.1 lysine 2,3-aminomutase [Spirochaetia bacterium]